MAAETCQECGFDGDAWTDPQAVEAIADLPKQWRDAVEGLTLEELQHCPIPDTWSVGEYADHVREVRFAMRFLLDIARDAPGTDLGSAPEPAFDPEPRAAREQESHCQYPQSGSRR